MLYMVVSALLRPRKISKFPSIPLHIPVIRDMGPGLRVMPKEEEKDSIGIRDSYGHREFSVDG